jgi:hypothetical protein
VIGSEDYYAPGIGIRVPSTSICQAKSTPTFYLIAMELKAFLLTSLSASLVMAQKAPTPEEVNGPENSPGGVFGGRMFGGGRAPNDTRASPEGMLTSAKPDDPLIVGGKSGGGFAKAVADNSGGSGQFTAWWTGEPSFPNHTIYAPKIVNPAVKLPVLVWGNGECRIRKFITF